VQPTPAPTPHFTAPPRTLQASDTTTGVNAELTLNSLSWGTELRLQMSGEGVRKGQVCALKVYDRSGQEWDAGSWRVAYKSGVKWSGGVALPSDQIGRIEVIANGDRKLVTINA
jgi:hypothetical protein